MTSLRAWITGAIFASTVLGCTATPQVVESPTTPATAGSETPTVAVTESPTVPPSEVPTADRTETDRTEAPRLSRRPRLQRVTLKTRQLAQLADPTAMAVRPGDAGLYVTEREGRIRVVRDGRAKTVLDWRRRTTGGNERGMLGLAFSPDGRHLYVYYIGQQPKHSYLDRFTMDGARADVRSRRNVLVVKQPPASSVHKGGQLVFADDGMLYLALGDGGPSDEPPDTSQDLSTLLGKLIRIQPTPNGRRPYRIPRDNPFVGRKRARGEIFATGLRNPWRFSFDRGTGDLWLADVGRYVQEEINLRRPRQAPGSNFGWPHFEGESQRSRNAPNDVVAPVHTYPHEDRCAVIGGYVYRGTAVPDLHGAYVYGDFCDGRVRALVVRNGRVVDDRPLGPRVEAMTSFGEDADGELYVLSLSRGLLRLTS